MSERLSGWGRCVLRRFGGGRGRGRGRSSVHGGGGARGSEPARPRPAHARLRQGASPRAAPPYPRAGPWGQDVILRPAKCAFARVYLRCTPETHALATLLQLPRRAHDSIGRVTGGGESVHPPPPARKQDALRVADSTSSTLAVLLCAGRVESVRAANRTCCGWRTRSRRRTGRGCGCGSGCTRGRPSPGWWGSSAPSTPSSATPSTPVMPLLFGLLRLFCFYDCYYCKCHVGGRMATSLDLFH